MADTWCKEEKKILLDMMLPAVDKADFKAKAAIFGRHSSRGSDTDHLERTEHSYATRMLWGMAVGAVTVPHGPDTRTGMPFTYADKYVIRKHKKAKTNERNKRSDIHVVTKLEHLGFVLRRSVEEIKNLISSGRGAGFGFQKQDD